jgi:hypothetical protein
LDTRENADLELEFFENQPSQTETLVPWSNLHRPHHDRRPVEIFSVRARADPSTLGYRHVHGLVVGIRLLSNGQ